eukprot:3634639-Amphidinium_carterae.1
MNHPELTEFKYKGVLDNESVADTILDVDDDESNADHEHMLDQDVAESTNDHDDEIDPIVHDHVPSIEEISDMFKQGVIDDLEEERQQTTEPEEQEEPIRHAGTLPSGPTFTDQTREELPPPENPDEVFRAVRRLHQDLGHPPPHALAHALAMRGARKDIII